MMSLWSGIAISAFNIQFQMSAIDIKKGKANSRVTNQSTNSLITITSMTQWVKKHCSSSGSGYVIICTAWITPKKAWLRGNMIMWTCSKIALTIAYHHSWQFMLRWTISSSPWIKPDVQNCRTPCSTSNSINTNHCFEIIISILPFQYQLPYHFNLMTMTLFINYLQVIRDTNWL